MSKRPYGRIVVVGVNWLGDALMMTPALRALRKAYPDAHLECLVPARVAGVFRRNPHLNGLCLYEDRASVVSASFWKTVLELRRKRFDLAVLFHGSRTKARMVRWAGIRERWGYERGPGSQRLLTRAIPRPEENRHRAQIFLDLLETLGIPPDGSTMDFVPDASAQAAVDEKLKKAGLEPSRPFVVVHGGGNWELKRWPVEHFRRWLSLFLQKYPDVSVVFCGSASEEGLARQAVSGAPASRVAVLAGQTNLDELAVLCRRAAMVLSNDSGPIHLAASQNARLVGLFGPTSPAQTGPWTSAPSEILWKDTGCEIPCYFRACDRRVCLERLTPESVLEACGRLLKQP